MTFKRIVTDVLILFLIIVFFSTLALLAVSTRVYRSYAIDTKENIMNRRNTGLMLFDRHGEMFFAFDRARPSTFISLEEVPDHVRKTIVASEDRTFFAHHGFSLRGIIRSAYLNWENQRLTYGGSTITQQLAKNSFLTPDKSFRRKFNELILAIKFERHFSKDDILEMYLNSAYFGEGVFGIEAAAQTYFNKTTQDLTLAEASMLASVLPEPANLSPLSTSDSERSKLRQRMVLHRMMEEGFITPEEKILAQLEKLNFHTPEREVNRYAPHFALMVRDELFQEFGEEHVIRSGFKVRTSLDLNWQRKIESELKNHVAGLSSYGATNGATVVIDPTTGEILSLVGSVDWHNDAFGKINMAIRPRQTGSAFKPIVYAAALQERRITPSTILQDIPRTFGNNYNPRNYDGRFRGNILARNALANSVNIPAIEVMQRAGPRIVLKTAEDLGITSIDPQSAQYLPTALGSEAISLLELTEAYGTFANYGTREPAKTILEIRDKYGDHVDYLHEEPLQALTAEAAFQVSSILSDPQARAATFGNMLDLPFEAAVKTGTTQHFRDAWTIGYTPNLVVGVWIGNSNNTPMANLPGARGSAPLWRNLMSHFYNEIYHDPFSPPSGLLAVKVCPYNGLPLRDGEGYGYTEYFIPGTKPSDYCVIPTPTPEPDPETEEDDSDENDESETEKQIAGAQDNKTDEKPKKEKYDKPQENQSGLKPEHGEEPESGQIIEPSNQAEEIPLTETSSGHEEMTRREEWQARRNI